LAHAGRGKEGGGKVAGPRVAHAGERRGKRGPREREEKRGFGLGHCLSFLSFSFFLFYPQPFKPI
jgi:hypothetical protein